MRIVITGCKGQLGNALVSLLNCGGNALGKIDDCYKKLKLFPVDMENFDISDFDAVNNYIASIKPDLVINCAALTNVDACETKVELAERINSDGPKNLAIAAKNVGAKIVHISTDYVFAGDGTTPYVETDLPNPKTAYGLSKLHGEEAVLQNNDKAFIIRTAWLYGLVGNNFVKTVRRLGKEIGKITMVNDQRGNPTSAEDLSFHILALAATENYGIYHCTANGECTWFDFACEILKLSNIECDITPCSTDVSARPARRPAYSSLSNQKLDKSIGDKMRNWKDALEEYITKLEKMEAVYQ